MQKEHLFTVGGHRGCRREDQPNLSVRRAHLSAILEIWLIEECMGDDGDERPADDEVLFEPGNLAPTARAHAIRDVVAWNLVSASTSALMSEIPVIVALANCARAQSVKHSCQSCVLLYISFEPGSSIVGADLLKQIA